MELKKIAQIHTDFSTKFGVPRQSGLADTAGQIVFEEVYRNREAVHGLEEYSHLWILWGFSENRDRYQEESTENGWHPTVRPPRLGGNKRIGVFASRSPMRPNPIGLSCVRLERIEFHPGKGPILHVSGVDMVDGTPIYDIKPYLPYVDCRVNARGGFSDLKKDYSLNVHVEEQWLERIPEEKRQALIQVLTQDPRPAYHHDDERVYGMEYAGFEVKFTVADGELVVRDVIHKMKEEP